MADRARPGALRGIRPSGALVGVVPFFAYTTVFLIIPTLVVVIGAFLSGGQPTFGNVRVLTQPAVVAATQHSVVLSAVTAASCPWLEIGMGLRPLASVGGLTLKS